VACTFRPPICGVQIIARNATAILLDQSAGISIIARCPFIVWPHWFAAQQNDDNMQ